MDLQVLQITLFFVVAVAGVVSLSLAERMRKATVLARVQPVCAYCGLDAARDCRCRR